MNIYPFNNRGEKASVGRENASGLPRKAPGGAQNDFGGARKTKKPPRQGSGGERKHSLGRLSLKKADLIA